MSLHILHLGHHVKPVQERLRQCHSTAAGSGWEVLQSINRRPGRAIRYRARKIPYIRYPPCSFTTFSSSVYLCIHKTPHCDSNTQSCPEYIRPITSLIKLPIITCHIIYPPKSNPMFCPRWESGREEMPARARTTDIQRILTTPRGDPGSNTVDPLEQHPAAVQPVLGGGWQGEWDENNGLKGAQGLHDRFWALSREQSWG